MYDENKKSVLRAKLDVDGWTVDEAILRRMRKINRS